jgi:hypothetical protein
VISRFAVARAVFLDVEEGDWLAALGPAQALVVSARPKKAIAPIREFKRLLDVFMGLWLDRTQWVECDTPEKEFGVG